MDTDKFVTVEQVKRALEEMTCNLGCGPVVHLDDLLSVLVTHQDHGRECTCDDCCDGWAE